MPGCGRVGYSVYSSCIGSRRGLMNRGSDVRAWCRRCVWCLGVVVLRKWRSPGGGRVGCWGVSTRVVWIHVRVVGVRSVDCCVLLLWVLLGIFVYLGCLMVMIFRLRVVNVFVGRTGLRVGGRAVVIRCSSHGLHLSLRLQNVDLDPTFAEDNFSGRLFQFHHPRLFLLFPLDDEAQRS